MESLLERVGRYSVPELCDGAGLFAAMDYEIKPRVTEKKIVGYALTVKVAPGDSGIIPDAIVLAKPGDVIVIAAGGHCQSACWGDHRSFCAKFRNAEGVVIDGAFRDIEGCGEIGFPIYARGVRPGAGGKSMAGAINVPVACGGVAVNPGDLIVGDKNGVCVIRPDDIEEVLAQAQKKIDAQNRTVAEMIRTGVVMPRIVVK